MSHEYVCQLRSPLVQVMTWCLIGDDPYVKPILLQSTGTLITNFNGILISFHKHSLRTQFETIVCKIPSFCTAAMLSNGVIDGFSINFKKQSSWLVCLTENASLGFIYFILKFHEFMIAHNLAYLHRRFNQGGFGLKNAQTKANSNWVSGSELYWLDAVETYSKRKINHKRWD